MLISVNTGGRAEVILTQTLETGEGWWVWLSVLALIGDALAFIALSSVAGIERYALIETCGGSVPCLDKVARTPGGPFSDDEGRGRSSGNVGREEDFHIVA